MTPVLSFSESAIARNVRMLNEFTAGSDRGWAAALPRTVPISILRELILPTTKVASCSRVCDAEHLAHAGFETIILTGRVIDSGSLGRLRRIAERTQVIVVVDHFRHAELLSQCMVESNREIQVLIEVDVGRQSTGVRPGPDAFLLATATSLLPGLRVIGIFASASAPRAEQKHRDMDCELAAIVTIAQHALRSICEASPGCRNIVVSVASVCRSSLPDERINCLIVSPFIHPAGLAQDTACQTCVSLIATVISRPTLEWCVIDAGTNALGDIADASICVPSGATMHHATSETSTLLLSGAACDLRIGDPVRLEIRNPERLLNQLRLSQVKCSDGVSTASIKVL